MSPTTSRVALRRASTLLVAAALVGGPATSAFADPTAEPSPSATSSASPSAAPSEPASPPATVEPSASSSPEPSAQPSATTPAPSPSTGTGTPTATPSPEDVGGLVAGGSTTSFGPKAAAGPATSTDPTLVAADYLERELVTTGYTLPIEFDGVEYAQYGLVADAVLALDAAGTGQDAAAAATSYLASHVVDYVGFGDPTEVAAGAASKLLTVAVAQGVDPRAFGGTDLVATVEGLEGTNGRFSDTSKYGDYSNAFGQSFAMIGLTRAGETVSANARSFLLAQQCTDGGFRLNPGTTACSSDPDATAMAVQALLAVGGASADAAEGLDFLASRQQSDGGVGGAGPTAATNANTTGLAGQAFLAGGRTAQARAAVGYLTDLQYGCDFPAVLRGGIAYNRAAYDAQDAAGAAATPQDQDRRSTSQALLALAGTPLVAVTSAGADALAPSLTCAAPTSTSQPTSSGPGTTTPTVTTEPTEGSGSSDDPTPVASGPGSLAQTGSDLLWPVSAGLVLLVAGGLAVAASRRRGAHA